MVTSRAESAYVTSVGEEICATTQAAPASARTVRVTVSVTAPRTCVRVVMVGPETGVKSQTVPVRLTASVEGIVMPLWTRQGVKIAPKDGWVLHAMIHASTVRRRPWTAAYVFARQDGSALDATANVLNMERSSMVNASVTAGGVEPIAKIQGALVTARIVLGMGSVTVQLMSVTVMLGGLVTDVIFQTALEIQTVPTEVRVTFANDPFKPRNTLSI